MLYDAVANTHDLAIDSFKALVAPRSIGNISKLGKNGIVNSRSKLKPIARLGYGDYAVIDEIFSFAA
jgi:hypothetical protein